jgi:hypothetical protein
MGPKTISGELTAPGLSPSQAAARNDLSKVFDELFASFPQEVLPNGETASREQDVFDFLFRANEMENPPTRKGIMEKYNLGHSRQYDRIVESVREKVANTLAENNIFSAGQLSASIDPFAPRKKVENVQQLFNSGILKIGKDRATPEKEKLDRQVEAAAQDVGIYKMRAAKEVFVPELENKSVFVASMPGGLRVVNDKGILEGGEDTREIASQEAITTGEVSISPKGEIFLRVMGIDDPEMREKLLLSGRVSPENFAKLGHFYPAEKVFLINSSPSILLSASVDPLFYSKINRTVEESKQGRASGAQWKAMIKNSKLGVSLG